MLALQLDFWFCSCCGQWVDGADVQPTVVFENGDFECAVCVVLDEERRALDEAANV